MKIYLKEWRLKKRMTRVELLEKASISRTALWYLENNQEHAPKMDTLVKIADALDIKVTSLFSMPK